MSLKRRRRRREPLGVCNSQVCTYLCYLLVLVPLSFILSRMLPGCISGQNCYENEIPVPYYAELEYHAPAQLTPSAVIYEKSDRRVIMMGMARSLSDLKKSTLESIQSYCEVLEMSVHIQTRDVDHSLTGFVEKELSNCIGVEFIIDAETTEGVVGLSNSTWDAKFSGLDRSRYRALGKRVQRIARAREGLLRNIRQYVSQKSLGDDLEAIIVLDLDLIRIPNATALRSAVDAVGHGGEWHAVCANGIIPDKHDNGGPIFYDTFATVLNYGTFVTLPVHYAFHNLLYGDKHGFVFHDGNKMRQLETYFQSDERPTIPVRSCFGGMAVYRATQLTDIICTYSWKDTETEKYKIGGIKGDGDLVCEHIRFHFCLEDHMREANKEFRIGISKALETRWGGEDEIPVVKLK